MRKIITETEYQEEIKRLAYKFLDHIEEDFCLQDWIEIKPKELSFLLDNHPWFNEKSPAVFSLIILWSNTVFEKVKNNQTLKDYSLGASVQQAAYVLCQSCIYFQIDEEIEDRIKKNLKKKELRNVEPSTWRNVCCA